MLPLGVGAHPVQRADEKGKSTARYREPEAPCRSDLSPRQSRAGTRAAWSTHHKGNEAAQRGEWQTDCMWGAGGSGVTIVHRLQQPDGACTKGVSMRNEAREQDTQRKDQE